MMIPEYEQLLPEMGLREGDVRNILNNCKFSIDSLAKARKALTEIDVDGVAAVTLGSLGRWEASSVSDLDLAFLYSKEQVSKDLAQERREQVNAKLRELGFDIPEKTFDSPIEIQSLCSPIGGRAEKNYHLTYRSLVLTEGQWLLNASFFEELRNSIFKKYCDGHISRGRNLTSLANDLHRYYRTLCVDYRWKVEEEQKPWAIRVMKLRHSRKVWHLGNLCVQCCALGKDEDHDAFLSEALHWAPLYKIASTMKSLGKPSACADLFVAYDAFLEWLSDGNQRKALEGVRHGEHEGNKTYQRFRQNARRLQEAASAVFDVLYDNHQEHLKRFVIL